MKQYVGLDVSSDATAVCVIDEGGTRRWKGVCRSTPGAIMATVRRHAPRAAAVALETGPLAAWLWRELRAAGVPAVCVHARHAHAALAMQLNKTDRNDAHGLAQLLRSGWYRPVEMKSLASHEVRSVLAARAQLVKMRTAMTNQIRGLLKTFGVVVGPARGKAFETRVRAAAPRSGPMAATIDALLTIWGQLGAQRTRLERQIAQTVRGNPVYGRLMTAPGVGMLTAAAFVAAIDDPGRFRRSRNVGAYLGLTPRRYQSGEVDRAGRISKCGEVLVRTYLFEAAHALLTRLRHLPALRAWGLRLRRRIGPGKAKVAVARKLAVILHRMWCNNTAFSPMASAIAA